MTIRTAKEFIALRTSSDPAEYLRAAREDAPPEVWLELVRSHPEMHFWVAQNKQVPLDVLQELALNGDSRVRWMVATKRKANEDILRTLSRDKDDGVRLAVAKNPRTSKEILQTLLNDSWIEVRRAAERALVSKT